MTVRLIKNSWWVDFRCEYIRYRKRSPENSRTGAQAYEALLRRRLARGEPLDAKASEPLTFKRFAENWFDNYVRTNNKPSEQRQKKFALQSSLVPFFGKMPLDAIGKKDVELYKAREQRKGSSNKTINNKLGVLRKCLATAYDWEAMRSPPPKIKQLRPAPPKTDFLTPAEAQSLLANAEGTTREMILLALRTGMRQGEIRGLQWEALDWSNRILTVRHSLCDYSGSLTSPKSNRERHIPLSDDLHDVLYRRRKDTGYVFLDVRGRPFPQPNHLYALRKVQEHAGLRKIGWHTLRHTFATQLAAKAPLRTVQELLGHSTITMTMRYSHVSAENLRAAIDTLNGGADAPMFWATGGQLKLAVATNRLNAG